MAGLEQHKFALLEANVVRDEHLDAFHSTDDFKLAMLQQIANFLLRGLLHRCYLRVEVGFSCRVLRLTYRRLVEEGLGSGDQSPIIEQHGVVEHRIDFVFLALDRLHKFSSYRTTTT